MLAPLVARDTAVASGQENGVAGASDPTAHRHLGFYLHLDIGVGYLGTSASQGGPSLSGAAVPLSIIIEGAVAEDWIIAGDLWAAAGPSPVGSTWGATAVARVGLNVRTTSCRPTCSFPSARPSLR